MPLNAQVSLSILAHETSSGDISRQVRVTPATYTLALSDGTAANQAQIAWSDARSLSGASESLNLSAISDVRDGASAVVSITSVKVFYVRNTHATIPLTFSGAALGSSGVSVAAGGAFTLVDPSASGMSSGTMTVSGASGGTYEIVIIGEGTVT